jgi:hypothetical protein
VMALRRYLRTWEDHYKNLTQLERALNITDANYRNLRRNVANYGNLNEKNKRDVKKKLLQHLASKLAGTDLHRAAKGAV